MAPPTEYGNRWVNKGSAGEGGQSKVFKVKDKSNKIKEICILKELKDKRRLGRFKDEIEALKKIDHPNILKIIDYDLDPAEGNPYYVSEYCKGKSLDKAQPFWHNSIEEKFRLCKEICAGLQAAHHHDPIIIHRDLKPANIYLRSIEGPAVLGDFGLCFSDEEGERPTLSWEQVGSRFYMHPELANGRLDDIQPYHDLYSLGKVIYWIFSQGKIFDRERHREKEYDLLGTYNGFSNWGTFKPYYEHINRVLDRMITLDTEIRYNDIDTVIDDLNRTQMLMTHKHNPIGKDVQQRCTYCGIGTYEIIQNKIKTGLFLNTYFTNKASQYPERNSLRVFKCSHCGHVEFFIFADDAKKNWEN